MCLMVLIRKFCIEWLYLVMIIKVVDKFFMWWLLVVIFRLIIEMVCFWMWVILCISGFNFGIEVSVGYCSILWILNMFILNCCWLFRWNSNNFSWFCLMSCVCWLIEFKILDIYYFSIKCGYKFCCFSVIDDGVKNLLFRFFYY